MGLPSRSFSEDGSMVITQMVKELLEMIKVFKDTGTSTVIWYNGAMYPNVSPKVNNYNTLVTVSPVLSHITDNVGKSRSIQGLKALVNNLLINGCFMLDVASFYAFAKDLGPSNMVKDVVCTSENEHMISLGAKYDRIYICLTNGVIFQSTRVPVNTGVLQSPTSIYRQTLLRYGPNFIDHLVVLPAEDIQNVIASSVPYQLPITKDKFMLISKNVIHKRFSKQDMSVLVVEAVDHNIALVEIFGEYKEFYTISISLFTLLLNNLSKGDTYGFK